MWNLNIFRMKVQTEFETELTVLVIEKMTYKTNIEIQVMLEDSSKIRQKSSKNGLNSVGKERNDV